MHATITTSSASAGAATARPPRALDPRLALDPEPSGQWRRRVITIAIWTLITLAVIAAGGWVIVGSMTRSAPEWWRHTDASAPETIRMANDLEHAISRHISQVRQGTVGDADGVWRTEPWTVAMKAEDANAWLNVRMPVWMMRENERFEWPEEMSDLQVHFDAPLMRIGAKVRVGEREHFLSATLTPELRDDGSLWVKANWIHVGRLPIPASWVLGGAEARADELIPPELRDVPEVRTFFRIVSGEEPVAERPVVGLPDGRRVRLLALRADEGWVAITCRTEYTRDAEQTRSASSGEVTP